MSRFKKALLKIRTSLFKGAFIHNPVLTQATGIFALICGAVSLRYALALSLTLGAVLIICESMTALLLKRLPRWLRVAFYALFGAVIVYIGEPFIAIVAGSLSRLFPVFFCLMGVNALVAVRCERFAVKSKLRYCIVDAVSSCLGFGAVAIITGLLREAVSSITNIPAVRLPFIAFAVAGFLAAAHKAVVIKFYPEEKADTFSMKNSADKISLRDPGLSKKNQKKVSHGNSENYDIIKLRTTEKEGE